MGEFSFRIEILSSFEARLNDQDTARMHGLDTLRACAIVMVMIFHEYWRLPEVLEPIGHVGWMGVDLFFVLSGYLIGRQLLKPYLRGEKIRLGEFYRRRAYRILPAYGVVTALYFMWPMWRERPGLSPLWEFVTFTENLFVDYAKNQAFSHVWSLCVEEHFYLLLPLVVIAARRRASVGRVAAVVGFFVLVGFAARTWELVHVLRPLEGTDAFGARYIEGIYYPTWCRLDGLIAGVVLAAVETFRPAWWRDMARFGHVSMGAGLGLFGLAVWMFADRGSSAYGRDAWASVAGFPVLSVGLALLVLSSVSDGGVLRRFRVPGAGWLATLAYGLYLTHKEVIHLVNLAWPWMEDRRSWGVAAIYLACCLVVAGVLYLGVERPFMRVRDRRAARLDPAI